MVGETPESLLAQLRSLGGDARFEGDRLVFTAPAAVFIPESLKAALAECRAAVADLILAEQAGELAKRGILRCQECRRLMLAYHLAHGVCDDCLALPRAPDQDRLFSMELEA